MRHILFTKLDADAANIEPAIPVAADDIQATTIVVQEVATQSIIGVRRPPVTVAGTADTTAVVGAAGNWGEFKY